MCGMNEGNCNDIPTVEDLIESGVPFTEIPFNPDGSFGEATSYNMQNIHIENYQYEALASVLLPSIVKYFETVEGQAEYAKWKAEREALGLPPITQGFKKKSRRKR